MEANVQFIFLDLISKHDGQWSWYQIDRALNSTVLGGKVRTMEVIDALVDGRFITGSSLNVPQPLYQITERGQAWLEDRQRRMDTNPSINF